MLHRLASALRSDRPFYGMRTPGRDRGDALIERMEDLAAHHVAQIRQVQPQGPYAVGGYSFGGFVAAEVARQLDAGGETVECIVFIDTRAPGVRSKRPATVRLRRLAHRVWRSRTPAARPSTGRDDEMKAAGQRALRTYKPSPAAIPVVVLSTQAWRERTGAGDTLGWDRFSAGPITTHPIPGRHFSAIDRPHVAELGATLGAVLGDGAGDQ
jgi:thioesterase domain-containing protein